MKKSLPFAAYKNLVILVLMVVNFTPVFAQTDECPAPANFQVSNITMHEATLTWEGPPEPVYEMRVYADGVYQDDEFYVWPETNSINLEQLLSNADYEVRLFRYCELFTESPQVVVNFKTLPDCDPPTNFQFYPGIDSVAVTWDAEPSFGNIVSLTKGDIEVESFETDDNRAVFYNLEANTIYNFNLTYICPDGSEQFYTNQFSTLSVQYCTSNGTNAEKNHLGLVSFADISRNSGSDGGYSDNTDITANVTSGESYVLTLKAGGLPNKKYISVWIDFNADGDFNDTNEEVANFAPRKNEVVNTSVEIPDDAVVGTTRMRIVLSQHKGIAPCGSFAHGETEDYGINIYSGRSADALSFEAYPNPASDKLNIDTTVEGPITIINSVGTVMFSGKTPDVLPVNTWPNGFYYIIINAESRKTIRIAKN